MDLKNMAEPTTATGGVLLLNKLLALLIPFLASLIAFWLGIRFVPIRKEHIYEDMINRVIACLISSFVLGITALTLLYNHYPSVFEASRNLALMAGLPDVAGFFTFAACVLIVCATPGPWIVAAFFLWLEKRKGKDIGEMFKDLRHDFKNTPQQGWYPPENPHAKDVTSEGCATEEDEQHEKNA